MPTVMGGSTSEQEKALLSLPVRMGGIGIQDPVESAQCAYTISRDDTAAIYFSLNQRKNLVHNTNTE